MERLRPALEPHVIDLPEGLFLAETCPPHLAELHAKLAQIGYANGFIKETA
jgi:hypothetical protein